MPKTSIEMSLDAARKSARATLVYREGEEGVAGLGVA